MADTVREKIMDDLKTTLAGITTANGYANTLASVQRWKQNGNSTADAPCLIIVEGSEDSRDDRAFNHTDCELTVGIILFVREAENATSDTGEILNSILGDIKKALNVDITRGGYAIDTSVRNTSPFEVEKGDPVAGLIIETMIHYRHLQTDPTTAV